MTIEEYAQMMDSGLILCSAARLIDAIAYADRRLEEAGGHYAVTCGGNVWMDCGYNNRDIEDFGGMAYSTKTGVVAK